MKFYRMNIQGQVNIFIIGVLGVDKSIRRLSNHKIEHCLIVKNYCSFAQIDEQFQKILYNKYKGIKVQFQKCNILLIQI